MWWRGVVRDVVIRDMCTPAPTPASHHPHQNSALTKCWAQHFGNGSATKYRTNPPCSKNASWDSVGHWTTGPPESRPPDHQTTGPLLGGIAALLGVGGVAREVGGHRRLTTRDISHI